MNFVDLYMGLSSNGTDRQETLFATNKWKDMHYEQC
jgi:hypothetical protein